MIRDCTAIILAGGDSRRMGCDKAMMPFHNQVLIQSVIEKMQSLFSATILSVRVQREQIELPQVCDMYPNGGPLTGLVSALGSIATPWAFVVACDMPFIAPELVTQLAGHRAKQQAVVPVFQGHLQPLFAFYSVSSIPMMRATLALGDKSISGAIRHLDVSYINEAQFPRTEAAIRNFTDLDTPQDWALAQAKMG
jgi:molybdopterin-guanine dinucleotide biosynthesis protein A